VHAVGDESYQYDILLMEICTEIFSPIYALHSSADSSGTRSEHRHGLRALRSGPRIRAGHCWEESSESDRRRSVVPVNADYLGETQRQGGFRAALEKSLGEKKALTRELAAQPKPGITDAVMPQCQPLSAARAPLPACLANGGGAV